MRVIGLDLHRTFAEVAILEKGVIRHAGRVALEHTAVTAFAKALKRSDEVVVEATGNTAIVVRLLKPYVRRVIVAKPRDSRMRAAFVGDAAMIGGLVARLPVPFRSSMCCALVQRFVRPSTPRTAKASFTAT